MTEKNIGTPGNSNELHEFPIEGGAITLHGILSVPDRAHGLVILPRGIKVQESDTAQRRAVAQTSSFHQQGLATLLVDLFSSQEHDLDMQTGYFRDNIEVMQQRITSLAEWLSQYPRVQELSIGLLGTGSIGTATLIIAAERPDLIDAVVVAEGRFDLAKESLPRITIPTLLIAPAQDSAAVQANQEALNLLTAEKALEQVGGVSSLFESDEGTKEMLRLAGQWFAGHLVTIPAADSQEL